MIGLMAWHNQKITNTNAYITNLLPEFNMNHAIAQLANKLAEIKIKPRVLIIGAGRSGSGAYHVLKRFDIHATVWTREHTHTRTSAFFTEILNYDILLNCINLSEEIEPFITSPMLVIPHRKLSVCVDISCDYTSAYNPLPIYTTGTTFDNVTYPLITTDPVLDIIAIDNLPSYLPLVSSINFANQLYDLLLELEWSPVWMRARARFVEVCERVD